MSMEEALIQERKKKTDDLRAAGINPFANDFRATHTTADIHTRFGSLSAEALAADGTTVAVAGRVLANRSFGKATFLRLQDAGGQLQLFVRKDEVGDAGYALLQSID